MKSARNNMKYLWSALWFFCSISGYGQSYFSEWTQILQHTVSDEGKVNYSLLKTKYEDQIQTLAKKIATTDIQNLNESDQLAFYINVYNLSTIQLILQHWPVNSIRDIANGEPWDLKWIKINNTTYSLNEIEHEIIRKKFDEPRIHFAVNCAAKSCPPLLNRAYTGDRLDADLKQQTKLFFNDPTYNTISSKKIEISQLMNWYKEDFGNIIDYINQYSTIKISKNAQISYKDYDWALNK